MPMKHYKVEQTGCVSDLTILALQEKVEGMSFSFPKACWHMHNYIVFYINCGKVCLWKRHQGVMDPDTHKKSNGSHGLSTKKL